MSDIIKIPFVKNDAITSVEFSGAFLSRLYDLLYYYVAKLKIDVAQLKENIKKEIDPKDDDEYNAITIVILISEIERNFKKAGLVDYEEVNPSKTNPNSQK